MEISMTVSGTMRTYGWTWIHMLCTQRNNPNCRIAEKENKKWNYTHRDKIELRIHYNFANSHVNATHMCNFASNPICWWTFTARDFRFDSRFALHAIEYEFISHDSYYYDIIELFPSFPCQSKLSALIDTENRMERKTFQVECVLSINRSLDGQINACIYMFSPFRAAHA